jgi:ribosome-associated toxin RatA of RatAB toxin-antitoxin module
MGAMAEQAHQTIIIDAPPESCFAVATDFAVYPLWAKDVKEAVVCEVDDGGRAIEVEFRAAAFGRSTHYRLHYDYSSAPHALEWKLTSGDLMRACDGRYEFRPVDGGRTEVDYHLAIELVVALPGFVKRRAEVRILSSVRELKARVEELR